MGTPNIQLIKPASQTLFTLLPALETPTAKVVASLGLSTLMITVSIWLSGLYEQLSCFVKHLKGKEQLKEIPSAVKTDEVVKKVLQPETTPNIEEPTLQQEGTLLTESEENNTESEKPVPILQSEPAEETLLPKPEESIQDPKPPIQEEELEIDPKVIELIQKDQERLAVLQEEVLGTNAATNEAPEEKQAQQSPISLYDRFVSTISEGINGLPRLTPPIEEDESTLLDNFVPEIFKLPDLDPEEAEPQAISSYYKDMIKDPQEDKGYLARGMEIYNYYIVGTDPNQNAIEEQVEQAKVVQSLGINPIKGLPEEENPFATYPIYENPELEVTPSKVSVLATKMSNYASTAKEVYKFFRYGMDADPEATAEYQREMEEEAKQKSSWFSFW